MYVLPNVFANQIGEKKVFHFIVLVKLLSFQIMDLLKMNFLFPKSTISVSKKNVGFHNQEI